MASAALSPPPKLQFFDANGNPLVGGKVYTYAAGTTTPLATYADAGGVTTNSNPVILDSRGEAGIWLNSAAYKFVLKTAEDVSLWTVDNVTSTDYLKGIMDAFKADLANASDPAKGDALVGFRQSNASGNLANTVNRTVHQKLQEMISVKDFGATGDGTTDDTTAIQNAINALGTDAIYGALYFPAGTYIISSTIVVANPIYLVGAGPGTYGYPAGPTVTQLKWNGSSGSTVTMLRFGMNGSEPFNGGGIAHMSLDANNLAGVTLDVVDAIHSMFTNIGLYRFSAKGLYLRNSAGVVYPTGLHTFNDLNIIVDVTGTNTATGIYIDGDISGGQTLAGVTLCTFDGVLTQMDQGPSIYYGNRGDNFIWKRVTLGGKNVAAANGVWFAATDPATSITGGNTFINLSSGVGMQIDGAGCNIGMKVIALDEFDIENISLRDPNVFVHGAGANDCAIEGLSGTRWGQDALNGSRNTFYHDGMQFIRWDSANDVLQTFAGNWKSYKSGTGTITAAGQLGSAVTLTTGGASSEYVSIQNMSPSDVGDGLNIDLRPQVYCTFVPVSQTNVRLRIGWMSNLAAGGPTDGLYMEFDPSTYSKIQFVARASSVETRVDSAYDAAGTDPTQFKLQLCPNPASANFYVRKTPNVLFEAPKTITTNIPSGAVRMMFVVQLVATEAAGKSAMIYDTKMSYQTEW